MKQHLTRTKFIEIILDDSVHLFNRSNININFSIVTVSYTKDSQSMLMLVFTKLCVIIVKKCYHQNLLKFFRFFVA